jgi:hypothetical protein
MGRLNRRGRIDRGAPPIAEYVQRAPDFLTAFPALR